MYLSLRTSFLPNRSSRRPMFAPGTISGRCSWEKKEQGVTANRLTIHSLGKNSLDAPIRKELGNREEITLAHFVHLVRQQSQGQDGVLLTNGYANVAYIKGNDGNMWAVNADWYSDDRYWRVEASSVENPGDWLAGDQVFSCDC